MTKIPSGAIDECILALFTLSSDFNSTVEHRKICDLLRRVADEYDQLCDWYKKKNTK